MLSDVLCRRSHGPVWGMGRQFGLLAGLSMLASGCALGPEPFTGEEILTRVHTDGAEIFKDQEPVSGPIDLYEAVARGLKYNLDKRLKQYERGLARAKLEFTHMGMLPKLALSAGYRGRDNVRASSSRNILGGVGGTFSFSTSEDKHLRTADLQMVWNVLDFGLTYLRSRQDADRVLIAEERRIKVAQNVILDIRDAYWRAVAAQYMLPRVNAMVRRIRAAIERSRSVAASGVGEPVDELKVQQALLEHLRDLTEVRRRLTLAKAQLAALMNLAPGTRYSVRLPRSGVLRLPRIRARLGVLEEAALMNRPELREEDYKKRISLTDVEAAYVRLLPGLELRLGRNYDSNSFLFNENWGSLSFLVTKNLMELATAPRAIGVAEAGVAVADARRRALSMAVVAQVHVARHRMGLARVSFRATEQLYDVNRRLAAIARRSASSTARSEAEALEATSKELVLQLKYFNSYADVQNSYGRLLNSLGAPRLPEGVEELSVKELARLLRKRLNGPPKAIVRVADIKK